MDKIYNNSSEKSKIKSQWNRSEVVSNVIDFEASKNELSQRKFSEDKNIPRTTLQYWLKRKEKLDASAMMISFFESPDGVAFLHRLIVALHFEFTKHGPASIHNICRFLELSGLSTFVASSYGIQQKMSKTLDSAIIEFAQFEQKRLSAQMPRKKITLCEDETFHPEVCLVAMEAMSNFIILEKYVANRDGATWNKAIEEARYDLPVDVIQSSSDEGKGLLNHVQKGLKVHHSPDTFHVSYEISKGMNGALCSEVKHLEKEYELAQKRTQEEREQMEKYENQSKRPVGRRPAFEKKIANAESAEQRAGEKLYQAQQNQELVRTAKAEISYVYHPYSLQTGEKQDTNTVSERLEECFNQFKEVANSLSDRCQKHIKKAYRVVETMKSTIAFFFHTINLYVKNMNISVKEQKVMHEYIIPGFYLQEAARKEKDPQRKKIISEKSKELLSILYERDGLLGCCNKEKCRYFEAVGRECAGVFQRSSSCVEGRNAQLSLHHHGLHRLDNHKLQALTAVHNYYVKREDGTTAAERFFESKPNDMFQWLLDHFAMPARPRGQKKLA